MSDFVIQQKKSIRIKDQLMHLDTPKVMGILNVTTDSFYDGGKYLNDEAIIKRVEQMVLEGADMIDIGGYSTRPGASDIPVELEKKRVLQSLKIVVEHFPDIVVSIDTFRVPVAEEAINLGAHIINDISGGRGDDAMLEFIGKNKIPYVLMHSRGNPENMQTMTDYEDLLLEVIDFLQKQIFRLQEFGAHDIMVDPGFGFAKNIEQNFYLLNHLEQLSILDKPILAGLSRKSMTYKTLDIEPQEALNGTTALNMFALQKGASILRVHDVKEAVECIKLAQALKKGINED